MTGLAERLNKAIRAADNIERGEQPKSPVDVEQARVAHSIKHYTVYSITGTKETPIAWRLYAPDVSYVIAAARRKMLRASESIVEGDPLYVSTNFEAREEIWE